MARKFEIKPAVRSEVPILVGLFGASGSGKTFSMLRIAEGMKRVRGGKTVIIDTEARRALHYADRFEFEHLEMSPPFGPLDYLAACEAAVEHGATVIGIDSASHMHEGQGGMLEQHAANVERMSGGDSRKAERVNFAAWIKPKQEFQTFKGRLLQLNVALIMCFRAKRKIKPVPGKEPREMGWQPIINQELPFEMTVNALLEPGCDGVPTWAPEEKDSAEMVKLPAQFREHFRRKQGPLDEADGELLARWASGAEPEPQEYRIPKGKYEGKTLQEVPEDYLTRLHSDAQPGSKLQRLLEAEITRRIGEQKNGS